jgi:hypothetical protein
MSSPAPVVIFTYKRLPVLRRVMESLLANPDSSRSHLIVYSDGPKTPSDAAGVNEVRDFVRGLRQFKSIEFKFRDSNLGLARSFIAGITETFANHERAIFLEDDNLLSPYFLAFMNSSLDRFEQDSRVICITGYSFPLWPKQKAPYFVRGAETWSMASWRRGWQNFDADAVALKRELDAKGLAGKIDRDGFGFYEMLQSQIDGRIDSWGVRWWTSAFLKELYCLYPHEPLCVSIGYGEESVHCPGYSPLFRLPEHLADKPITALPGVPRASPWVTLLLRLMNIRLRLWRAYSSTRQSRQVSSVPGSV